MAPHQPLTHSYHEIRTVFLPLLTAAALCLAPASHAQEGGEKKLAITKIASTDSLTKRMAKQGVGLSLDSVLEALDSQVYDRVLNTRRFEILERSDADALATESAAAGEAFNFNKADYILTIRVDSFNDRMEERRLAALGKTVRARVIELSAVGKITEVATQRAIASTNFKVTKRDSENRSNTTQRVGEGSDDLLIQAVAEMAQKIAVRAADVVSPARIIGKRDKVVVRSIAMTNPGIKVGQTWEVFVLGDEMVDDTGDKSREEILMGKVKVTRVTPQNSQAEVLEDTGIERGAVVRLSEDVEDAEE